MICLKFMLELKVMNIIDNHFSYRSKRENYLAIEDWLKMPINP